MRNLDCQNIHPSLSSPEGFMLSNRLMCCCGRGASIASPGHLIILGDGDERGALAELSRRLELDDRVTFRGMVANVADYMSVADIFVLPSASEGLSVALLEAMSSGAVPVATAISGNVDLIQHQETGLLVESGEVDGLRAALEQALSSPAWRSGTAQRARDHIVAGYDLRVIAAQLAQLYRDVLADRASH